MFARTRGLLNCMIPFKHKLGFKNINMAYGKPKRSLKQKMKKEINQEQLRQKSKQYRGFQVGLTGFIFACCFAAIPLYRVFCEHVGLIGDYDKKTYEFKQDKIVNVKKYKVKFEGVPETGINWEFEPVEKQVVVGSGQTAIVFFRLRNKENRPIVGFSTYNIYPEEVNLYFSKIQCFCFNQQMVNPHQQLLLPLFFYLEPQLIEDPDIGRISQLRVNYQFYQSNNQDLAKFAEQQLKRVQENKKKLNQIRANKQNMSLQAYEQMLQVKQQEQQKQLSQIKSESADPPLSQVYRKIGSNAKQL